MNHQYKEALKIIKSKAMIHLMVAAFPAKLVQKAMAAWPGAWRSWREPTKDWLEFDPSDAEHSKIMWLWEGTDFDQQQLYYNIGPSYGTLIAALAAGYLIYPDGTFNETFIAREEK